MNMDQLELINDCDKLLEQARGRVTAGFPNQAEARLTSLSQLLNQELGLQDDHNEEEN